MQSTQSEADFIYRLSHDLAAPIRQVNAFAALLKDVAPTEPDSDAAQYLDLIQRQSKLAQMMLNALVQLSRLGSTTIEGRNFPLRTLLEDITTACTELTLVNEVAPQAVVFQDPALLLKLLTLMAQNTCTHCANPQWIITSTTSTLPGHIDLLVQDNGPGLTLEQWTHYQHPFARNVGHADLDGLGMGLTMATKLGDLLKVNLRYANVDTGLAFRLTIPLSATT